MIDKGFISAIESGGAAVTVVPASSGAAVTAPLTVPWCLLGSLQVAMPVVYVLFPDNTGLILARMDGEWNHSLLGGMELSGGFATDSAQVSGALSAGSAAVDGALTAASAAISGPVSASDLSTSAVGSINSHTHRYERGGTGSSSTSGPA